ncbi:MarR family transcriptional regulator [Salinigranum halophilum]|uniref:MarR family transcriptional regulator n=1 Tax=Salinigranum halophilum TaxID=2565931 RepID=UPI0010A83A58|nr:MarR family transcriptional regulator [Salinigranum halophilum]
MSWTECPECDASLKEANAEKHVREQHPRQYDSHYPDASQRTGMAPCPECWEWLHVSKQTIARTAPVELTDLDGNKYSSARAVGTPEHMHHVASEHPELFAEEYPGKCIACALGMGPSFWPADEEEASFIEPDSNTLRTGPLAMLLERDTGVEFTEQEAAEHYGSHQVIEMEETVTGRLARVQDDVSAQMRSHIFIPSELEMDVRDATQPGDRATVPELAEATGYTDMGVRKKLDDMVERGLLELVDDGRPAVYERLEEDSYPDRDAWEERRARNDEIRENWNEDPKHIHESYQERPGLGLEPTKPIY